MTIDEFGLKDASRREAGRRQGAKEGRGSKRRRETGTRRKRRSKNASLLEAGVFLALLDAFKP
jgi:hypothetical protein